MEMEKKHVVIEVRVDEFKNMKHAEIQLYINNGWNVVETKEYVDLVVYILEQ